MELISPSFLYMCVCLLVGIVPTINGIRSWFTRTPRLQDEFVSKADYDRQQAEIKAELARHSASRKGIYEKLEVQGRSVERIEAVLAMNKQAMDSLKESLGETNEGLKAANRSIETLDSRIDAIPERVIRSLKEAKGLI